MTVSIDFSRRTGRRMGVMFDGWCWAGSVRAVEDSGHQGQIKSLCVSPDTRPDHRFIPGSAIRPQPSPASTRTDHAACQRLHAGWA